MKTTTPTLAVLGLLLLGSEIAESYDFFDLSRYPEGGKLKSGVELYTVTEEGGAPRDYQRRVVQWWPRKGVDIIEVNEELPLRTWTLRKSLLTYGDQDLGTVARRESLRSIKARLIGFRGIGVTRSSRYDASLAGDRKDVPGWLKNESVPMFIGDGGPIEPGVVLRLEDGRKRCFVRGSFCDEDKALIMDLYVKEMQRIKAGLDKTPYVRSTKADISFPNNAKPGEPGTFQLESEHVVFLSGSQAGTYYDPWMNEQQPDNARWFREASLDSVEYWWAYNEYAGHRMPGWYQPQQYKYEITISGTKRDGNTLLPGMGAGGGYGAMSANGYICGPWPMAIWHEWGHGTLHNHAKIGGGEAQADMLQCVADPSVLKGNHHLKAPWRNIFNGSVMYAYTMFYNMTCDDPNWGYAYFTCLPRARDEWNMLMAMARAGQQRGLFANGIRGFGDWVGDYGARLAAFDCELEDRFRRAYFAPTRSWMETVNAAEGIYRIPWDEAPEPFGVNIVRLVPEDASTEIRVDFRGYHDPELFSDWRACLVAVDKDAKCRYSQLWNKGEMTLRRAQGDLCYWLTVAATPTALYIDPKIASLGPSFYSGRHAYRYPWSAKLSGCRPGTPRSARADLDDAELLFAVTDAVPAPCDTAAGKRFLPRLLDVQDALAREEVKTAANNPPELVARAGDLKAKVAAEIERMRKGTRHDKGGGWVAATARVAPTAYVGADAMVLDNAQVLDHAIVDDYAVVKDDAVVAGHARVCGRAVAGGRTKLGGYSRTWLASGGGEATVVPPRAGEKNLDPFGLWANYAMDRHENRVIEDWYRGENTDRGNGMHLAPVLNGYLYGSPEFVVERDHRGFRFDGKQQYGELCPRLADLGEITINLTVKWQGEGQQTILDFGTSPANRLVLQTTPRGNPELMATVNGKVAVRIAAGQALTRNVWTDLRIEINGTQAVLWVNDGKAGEQTTDFRPCEVFPGGAAKRNFLAVSRGMSGHFQGVIDRVVVYHTVHDDFGQVPQPIRDAPLRPDDEVVRTLAAQHGVADALNRKVAENVRLWLAALDDLNRRKDVRKRELQKRDPDFQQAEASLTEAQDTLKQRRKALDEEFDKLPENAGVVAELDRMRRQTDELRAAFQAAVDERAAADPELKALQSRLKDAKDERATLETTIRNRKGQIAQQLAAADPRGRELRKLEETYHNQSDRLGGKRSLHIRDGTVALDKNITAAAAAVQTAGEKALQRYLPEKAAMEAFEQQVLGDEKSGYRSYLPKFFRAQLGIDDSAQPRDDLKTVTVLRDVGADNKGWHASADWDWRMTEEIDGSIADLPLLRKWLIRVRGK